MTNLGSTSGSARPTPRTDGRRASHGRREVGRLDARYADELDELASRYRRKRGETTARVDG